MKHILCILEMLDRQNSQSSTSVQVPMHQRYCCRKKLRGSSGQMPIARHSGRYLICRPDEWINQITRERQADRQTREADRHTGTKEGKVSPSCLRTTEKSMYTRICYCVTLIACCEDAPTGSVDYYRG